MIVTETVWVDSMFLSHQMSLHWQVQSVWRQMTRRPTPSASSKAWQNTLYEQVTLHSFQCFSSFLFHNPLSIVTKAPAKRGRYTIAFHFDLMHWTLGEGQISFPLTEQAEKLTLCRKHMVESLCLIDERVPCECIYLIADSTGLLMGLGDGTVRGSLFHPKTFLKCGAQHILCSSLRLHLRRVL